MLFSATGANLPFPEISQQAISAYRQRFGDSPHWISIAPGRVNLIGEHVDYNDGLVLPIAIDRATAIAAGPVMDGTCRIESLDATEQIRTTDFSCHQQPAWAAYMLGPLLLCRKQGLQFKAFSAVIASDVPRGAGLSSSAALEVASATLAELICGVHLDSLEKARLCQRAEHEFAGVPCGIMDQATSVAARAGNALLLDCQSETWQNIPFGQQDVCLLIANTNVRHSLSDGQYAARREECEQALEYLGKSSYRDIDLSVVEASGLETRLLQRARHVVSEIVRTRQAAVALQSGDWYRFGKLMNESHRSLADDYQVSCTELDTMAKIHWDLGPSRGVFGCRMTGGGFGGCTVSLVQAEAATTVADHVQQTYQMATGIEPEIFIVTPSDGAHGMHLDRSQKS